MKILITGGTGTIGKELAQRVYGDVTIFSRKEKDQVLMKQEYPEYSYVIGDVRDYSEVLKACEVDYVYHLAALKHINICEEQPAEAIKTNVIGTLNVINACKVTGAKMVNMSSDKAINAASVYGMTKKLGEDMALRVGIPSIRSGNVLWSSASVLPMWLKQVKETGVINLTSKEMTRFFISPAELANFIYNHKDKEGIFTPHMKSFKMYDIAIRFSEVYGGKINITGLRPGERLHEFRDAETSSDKNICNNLDYVFE